MVAILVIKEAGKLNSSMNSLTEIFRQWKKNAFRQIFTNYANWIYTKYYVQSYRKIGDFRIIGTGEMHLYLLKLLEISEIVRVKKITNGLKKSLLKIIKTTCSHDM